MKRSTCILVGLTWLLLVLPPPVQAGGVVEEMRTDPDLHQPLGSRNNSLTYTGENNTPPLPCKTNRHAPTNLKAPTLPAEIHVRYLQTGVIVEWQPLLYHGQPAIRYLIYRWTATDTNRRFLGAVDGNVFEFLDQTTQNGVHYFYSVTGIYRLNGLYLSLNYALGAHVETPPSAGMACQMGDQPAPSLGCFLLLLALLWRRRRRT